MLWLLFLMTVSCRPANRHDFCAGQKYTSLEDLPVESVF